MKKCECSMSIRVLGDGCRYCQPQEYIDRLESQIDDMNKDEDDYLSEIDELKHKMSEMEESYTKEQ